MPCCQLLTSIHNQAINVLAVPLPTHSRGAISVSGQQTETTLVQAAVKAVKRVMKKMGHQFIGIPPNPHSCHWRWRREREGEGERVLLSHALKAMLVVFVSNSHKGIEGQFKNWNQTKGTHTLSSVYSIILVWLTTNPS